MEKDIISNFNINTKNMNFNEYQKQALVTNDSSASVERNNLHAGYGLTTELGEIADIFKRYIFYKKPIDLVNLKEEVGDTLWYLAIGAYARNLDMDNPAFVNAQYLGLEYDKYTKSQDALMQATKCANVIFNYYNKEFSEYEATTYFGNLYICLKTIAECFDFTLQEAADLNIQKLRKRFPEGFSEFDAINRNKENEMSHFSEPKEAVE